MCNVIHGFTHGSKDLSRNVTAPPSQTRVQSHISRIFRTRLAGQVVFCKVDLVRGYQQALVGQHDIPKTAVITLSGLLEVLRIPFNLRTPHKLSSV